jgi:tetratricopeptide (TPR) repeat protein
MTPEKEKLVEVATGYFELGMLNDALAELGPLAGHEQLSVLSLWSAALRLSERWQEMLSLTRKMVELYPTEAECWVSFADATRNSVSVQAGLELLETARGYFPGDGHILFQIGCYCCQLGRLDEARTAVRAAVSDNRVWAKIALQDRDLASLWPELKVRSPRRADNS